jgi:hypothetical protein
MLQGASSTELWDKAGLKDWKMMGDGKDSENRKSQPGPASAACCINIFA